MSPFAYRLQLSKTMTIHPFFYVSLLEPSASDPVPVQIPPPPPPIIVNNEEGFTIEEIFDSRTTYRNSLQYLVKWIGENETK